MTNPGWLRFGWRSWLTILICGLILVVFILAAVGALGDLDWWQEFLANLLAGGLIALFVGLFGLSLYQRWQESIKARERRREALTLLRDELSENNNKKEIEKLCNRLRHYRGSPIRSAFNTAVGDVVLDSGVLRGSDLSLQKGIHELYVHMREVNWLLRWVYEQSLEEMTKGPGFLVPEELRDWPAIEILPLVERLAKQLDEVLDMVTKALAQETGGASS